MQIFVLYLMCQFIFCLLEDIMHASLLFYLESYWGKLQITVSIWKVNTEAPKMLKRRRQRTTITTTTSTKPHKIPVFNNK